MCLEGLINDFLYTMLTSLTPIMFCRSRHFLSLLFFPRVELYINCIDNMKNRSCYPF